MPLLRIFFHVPKGSEIYVISGSHDAYKEIDMLLVLNQMVCVELLKSNHYIELVTKITRIQ